MPVDMKAYGPEWPEIRAEILARERNRCKFCGVANGAVGARDVNGAWVPKAVIELMEPVDMFETERLKRFGRVQVKIITIVLTIAHLDHDITDHNRDRLAALCQACHNNYDKDYRAANRKRNRLRKSGQLALIQGVVDGA